MRSHIKNREEAIGFGLPQDVVDRLFPVPVAPPPPPPSEIAALMRRVDALETETKLLRLGLQISSLQAYASKRRSSRPRLSI